MEDNFKPNDDDRSCDRGERESTTRRFGGRWRPGICTAVQRCGQFGSYPTFHAENAVTGPLGEILSGGPISPFDEAGKRPSARHGTEDTSLGSSTHSGGPRYGVIQPCTK